MKRHELRRPLKVLVFAAWKQSSTAQHAPPTPIRTAPRVPIGAPHRYGV